MTELLRELEAVVGLAEKATPGEWRHWQGTAVVILDQGAGGFDLSDCPQPAENAQAIASAVNFLRTHHAEIAEAVKDARRYRWLRDNCKREWESDMPHDRGKPSLDIDFSAEGHDLDTAIDAHNSAREVG